MFKDVEKKIKLYKEKIVKEIIDGGSYPSSEDIKNILHQIDPYKPLFDNRNVYGSEKLNVILLNEEYKNLYSDLCIIYEILEEITVKEIMELESYINSHISKLELDVSKYKKKAELEINSSMIGDTVLYKDSNFEVISGVGKNTIKLGEVELSGDSSVSFFVNINDIEPEKCRCILKDTKDEYVSTPYNFNQQSMFIKSGKKPEVHELSIDPMQKIAIPYELKINKVEQVNSYVVTSMKDKIKITENDGYYIYSGIETTIVQNDCTIEFYVVGGSKIEFSFSDKPVSCNFNPEKRSVSDMSMYHYIKIELKAGTVFSLKNASGEIYANKENGLVRGTRLYYTGDSESRDFKVFEHKRAEKKKYYAYVEVINDTKEPMKIENIMIKELFSY